MIVVEKKRSKMKKWNNFISFSMKCRVKTLGDQNWF